MTKSVWLLAAALTIPAFGASAQQSSTSSGDGQNHASPSTPDQNHAMQTGSPNDNGAGLTDNYGKTQPGKKRHKKHHHHHRSRKHMNQTEPNQSGTRGTGEVHPG